MDPAEARRRRLVDRLTSGIGRATGRRYQIDLDALDEPSLKELARLLRDLAYEKSSAVRRARLSPWKG